MKQSKTILLILILTTQLFLKGEWSDRVLLSGSDWCESPSIKVDSKGRIHAVWAESINYKNSYVVYSKSEDGGVTWTEPYKVSSNDTMRVWEPKLVIDSYDNPHIAYLLSRGEGSRVFYKKFNGITWSEDFEVEEFIITSLRMGIDHDDRVYLTWFMGDNITGKSLFTYFDNGWKDPIPISEQHLLIVRSNLIFDSENNLYLSGFDRNDSRAFLAKYSKSDEEWVSIEKIFDSGELSIASDIDICDGKIFSVISSGTSSLNNKIYFSSRFLDGNEWEYSNLIISHTYKENELVINNGVPYIFEIYYPHLKSKQSSLDKNRIDWSRELVCLYKNGSDWTTESIESEPERYMLWFDASSDFTRNKLYIII
ncbi:MAG: hypothetical protein CR982_04460 [Candidatus Cloacimonadota bacterium]|nr:MAG: hypothetical protein CR982_04460 [Candidatus Cloacimonadota bacterium]PIE79485.1 MAG: hypothetical protein CSA15_03010 [Candidatus Delongbacteria bacterium]